MEEHSIDLSVSVDKLDGCLIFSHASVRAVVADQGGDNLAAFDGRHRFCLAVADVVRALAALSSINLNEILCALVTRAAIW